MKKIYLILFSILSFTGAFAQCTGSAEINVEAMVATVTITGDGATTPMYGIDWGDGTTGELASSAFHVYTLEGNYNICWVYFDFMNTECNVTGCENVQVGESSGECAVSFEPFIAGLSVGLNAFGSGPEEPQYVVNWGDGSPADTSQAAGHTYVTAGEYMICIIMTDLANPEGCIAESCQTIILQDETEDCTVELTVTVDGNTVTATVIGDGAISENYGIIWGDGESDETSVAVHTYEDIDSTYVICGTYGDISPGGCLVSDCDTIEIEETVIQDCTVDFETFPVGLLVALQANGTGAANPLYEINWGDFSAIENGDVGSHNYNEPGTYTICVTYTDLDNLKGCSVTQCHDITVEEVSTECTVELTLTIDGPTVTVNATGEGADSPQYLVNWDDGTPGAFAVPATHTYTQSGSYNICVNYGDLTPPLDCFASDCEEVTLTVGVNELTVTGLNVSLMPNPVTHNGTISIHLDKTSRLMVEVIDLLGQRVSTLTDSMKAQGDHIINWEPSGLAPGIYFIRVKAGNHEQTIRAIRR